MPAYAAILIAIAAGVAAALQQPINTLLAAYVGPVSASAISFVTGPSCYSCGWSWDWVGLAWPLCPPSCGISRCGCFSADCLASSLLLALSTLSQCLVPGPRSACWLLLSSYWEPD